MNKPSESLSSECQDAEVDENVHFSAYRHAMIEDALIAAVQRNFWLNGRLRVEVLRSNVSDGGYSVVLEAKGVTRHIKFVSTERDGRRAHVDVNRALERKPSGCVVWVTFDPESLELGPFRIFSSGPGEPLGSLEQFADAVRTTPNAAGEKPSRPNIKRIGQKYFDKVGTLEELIVRLFG